MVCVHVCSSPAAVACVLMSPVEAHPFLPVPEQWLCSQGELGAGSIGEGPSPVTAFPAGRSSTGSAPRALSAEPVAN